MRTTSIVAVAALLGCTSLLPSTLPAQNPLARKAPVKPGDPWQRPFRGEGLRLELAVAEDGYVGSLVQGEVRFPVSAKASAPDRLEGTFRVGDDQFSFTCRLDEDTLTLTSDGATYTLRAEPKGAANPLAKAGKPEVADLADVHQGAVVPLRHPDGIFTTEVPKGWSVAQTQDDVMVVNPGLGEHDTLDAIVMVTWGELEEDERGKDLVELFTRGEKELLDGLRAQGIEVQASKTPPRKVAVGDRAGVEKIWPGRTAGAKVQVWSGALVEREYYLAVITIVIDGKEARFLPGAKRLFRSLQPRAPERNRAAEASLAGATFGSGDKAGRGGSFHTIYSFRADGTVKKEMLMSGSVGVGIDVGGSSEDFGRYHAVGPVLYLQFRDGQRTARLELSGDQVTAIVVDETRYARR